MNSFLHNMKQLFVLFIVMTMGVFAMKANPVDMNAAREVGFKFMNANAKTPMRGIDDLRLVTTYNISRGDAAFYIFNTSTGFVIVSADDCATPILGYSNEGQFDTENIPIQLQDYLQGFVEQIQYGIENRLGADEKIARQWILVRRTGWLNENRSGEVVEPLITALWNQGCYYNAMCPEAQNGPCGHCYTGCVATAMAQIMHYWGYPEHGTGSHSYTPYDYPEQSVDFGATTYDWDNMPNSLNSSSNDEQISAVATLMWHCGVSVDMAYGSSESAAGVIALPWSNYFDYSDDIHLEHKQDDETWMSLLKTDLDLGRPIFYFGCAGIRCHAFVCDGYDVNDRFHFNYGWGGIANGYFALNAISYKEYSSALFNIHPNASVARQVTASASPSDGGMVAGAGIFDIGSLCNLVATANDGYAFMYWTEDDEVVSTQAEYSFCVRKDRDLVAHFGTPFHIGVILDQEEGGTVSGVGEYDYGSTCTLTATTNEGYDFVCWRRADGSVVTTASTYSFTVTEAVTLTAVFTVSGGEQIAFADLNVKALCVANWDTNGDGELSYAEAAAVTDLGVVFKSNTTITSFEELQYFTGLTTIGNNAFYYCRNLSGSLYVPNSVTTIGNNAFRGCSGFTGILNIPNSVTTIGNYAFIGCSGFTGGLTIPNSVVTIGKDAFSSCSGFTGNLLIPNSVTTIGVCAFQNCSGFTGDLVIPNSVTTIGIQAFQNCSGFTGSLIIGDAVSSIESATFRGCFGFTGDLIIGNSVTEIGFEAFCDCCGFTGSLIIGNSVTTIKRHAFWRCFGFSGDLIIPNSVTTIESSAFYYCTGFTGSLILGNSLTTIGGGAFEGCRGFTGNLIIPDSVETIGNYAFYICSGFTGNLIIGNAVATIGDYAFYLCSGFTGNLTIGNSVAAIGDYFFYYCIGFTGSLTIGSSVATLGNSSFCHCDNLTSITVLSETPPTVEASSFLYCPQDIPVYVSCGNIEAYTTVNWGGFSNFIGLCGGMVTVVADPEEGGTVTGGGSYEAGQACTVVATANEGNVFAVWTRDGMIVSNSDEITFYVIDDVTLVAHFVPEGNIVFADANVKNICVSHWDTNDDGELSYVEAALVTSLGRVFQNNTEITSFEELQYFVNLTSIDDYAFYGCSGLTGDLVIPNAVTMIGNSAFSSCSGFTGNLTIGNAVTTIGNAAFSGCSGFTGSLNIGNSVSTIGNYAFQNCSGLTGNLVIPNSVTMIGNYVFSGCSGFTGSLTIPNSVVTIGNYAFQNCNGLTGNLVIPNSVTTIGNRAFYGCSGFTGSLTISSSLTTIADYAFYGCSGFTGSLNIPDSILTIGNFAFQNCSGFRGRLNLPNTLTTIGNSAFSGCSGFGGSLILPDSITAIGNWTFQDCSGFTGDLIIPDNVITIGYYAFSNCSGFTGSLIIGNSVTTIGNSAFINCSGFTGDLTIPNSVTTIDRYAFQYCTGFSGNLTIGNSVSTIRPYAFSNCRNIASMTVLDQTPPVLGDQTFANVNKSIPVYVPYGRVGVYQSTAYWSQFTNYHECVYTTISGYSDNMGHWRLLASPLVDSSTPTAVENMITETEFDLYQFNPIRVNEEWENYEAASFSLVNGQGYLYANTGKVNIIFKGEFYEEQTKMIEIVYDEGNPCACWNLVGNPFPCEAIIDREYYVMDEDGSGINPEAVPAGTHIPPCTAVFVKAVAAGDKVVFSKAGR